MAMQGVKTLKSDKTEMIDPSQQILLACINSNNNVKDIAKLREELKTLTTEVHAKRKELSIISINEEGLRKNIKHLEDIISIKVNLVIL